MNEIRETLLKSKVIPTFEPSFGLRNPHSQTILSSIGPRKALVKSRFRRYDDARSVMLLDGGDGVRLQGYLNIANHKQSDKLAILIHGWEGSHDSTYMQSMAKTLLDSGVDVFRLNLRDHGDTHHLNKALFNSTLVEEVMNSIVDLQSQYSYAQNFLLGFSLGGNFCMRVAAMAQDKNLSLSCVITFCPVIHAQTSNLALNQPSNRFYGHYFVRKWKRSLRKKLKHWPEYEYAKILDTVKTLDEMNELLIPMYTDYKDLGDYFDAYAITGEQLANTIAPCYLFFAEDDMIIPASGISDLSQNPDLHITVTERGGHCGYIKNWKWECWQDEQALRIIQTYN